ncbi:MAG TPA: hypothetical protein VGJ57_08825 [Nitrospirales bacterium]|jgi:hypothetical protein
MPEHLIPTHALIGAWIAVGLTLFIFSFLYKDNPLFKIGEHLYVGISVGYSVVVVWYTVFIRLIWEEIAKGNPMAILGGDFSDLKHYEPLIPVMIGLLIWTRFIPKIAWLSRLAFAFVVGFGSGVAIPRTVSSTILKQIEDTVNPLLTMSNGGFSFSLDLANPQSGVNTVILLVGVISVLFYFFFSVEHSGAGYVTARTGVYFLMIGFGAAFGYTVMSRMSLLIGRFGDLLKFSTADYGYATPILLLLTIVCLVIWERSRPRGAGSE